MNESTFLDPGPDSNFGLDLIRIPSIFYIKFLILILFNLITFVNSYAIFKYLIIYGMYSERRVQRVRIGEKGGAGLWARSPSPSDTDSEVEYALYAKLLCF